MKLRVLVPELTVDGTRHFAGETVEVPNNEASRLIRIGYATPNLSEQSDTAQENKGGPTAAQLREQLDKAGISYSSRAKKADLEALVAALDQPVVAATASETEEV